VKPALCLCLAISIVSLDCEQAEVIRTGDLVVLGNPLPELTLRQQSGEKRSARLICKRLRLAAPTTVRCIETAAHPPEAKACLRAG
jgi:hypothetical protein